jgi:mono/diheme cytochrome c family protein
MCVTCHGAPGVDREEIGKGLNPEPPRLEKIVANWTDAELFWTVKNGIRMTGMPGFGGTHTDAEVRSIVSFVRRLPRMSPQEYQRRVAAAGSHHEMSK